MNVLPGYQRGFDAIWAALGRVGVNHYEMMHVREPNDMLMLAARKLLELNDKTKITLSTAELNSENKVD